MYGERAVTHIAPVAVLFAVLLAPLSGIERAVKTAQSPAAQFFRWPPRSVIPVWIDPMDAPAEGSRLIELAMKNWTDAAEGRFRLATVGARDAAAVQVRFLRAAEGVYGETAPRVDPRTSQIVSARIALNGEMTKDGLDGQIVLYLTALHELGHALGLPHTDDFTTIMYCFQHPDDGVRYFARYRALVKSTEDIGARNSTAIEARDVQALRHLYDR